MPPSAVSEVFSISHAQILDGTLSFLDAIAENNIADDLDIYGVNDGSMAADTGNYDNQGDDDIMSRWYWLNFAEVSVQAGYVSFPLLAKMTGSPLSTQTISVANEVQSMSASGASAGTFKLSFRGAQTPTGITWSAAAAAIQTALEALPTIGAGNILVGGGPANTTAVTFTFQGTLAGQPVPMIVVDKSALTGATTGNPAVSQTTAGALADTRHSIDLWHEDSMNAQPRPLMLVCPAKDHLRVVRQFVFGLYSVQFAPIGFDGPTYKDGLKANYAGTALQSLTDEKGVLHADGKKRVGRLITTIPF